MRRLNLVICPQIKRRKYLLEMKESPLLGWVPSHSMLHVKVRKMIFVYYSIRFPSMVTQGKNY